MSIEEMVVTGWIQEAITAINLWNSNRIMCSAGRAFCVTKRGYVGMVPPGSEVGDMICILRGLNTPFVLRETKSTGKRRTKRDKKRRVQLVGEAYIHGMMDGEAITIEDRGDDEVFEIE